jgi:hypothetical protein
MEKENLNWRSFADDGSIIRQWNSPATPAYYVLDHTGVIQHKWVGNPGMNVIDDAVGKWISEAKQGDKPK